MAEPDGRKLSFDDQGRLTKIEDLNGNNQAIFFANGKISYVEDNFGRRIDFAYDTHGRLSALTTPIGQFAYDYDDSGNLTLINKPDLTTGSYVYEDPADPHNLTGVINEEEIRVATYTYDEQDRCITSEGAGGLKRISVSYDDNFKRRVTDARDNVTTYQIQVKYGIGRIKSASGAGCTACTARDSILNDRLQTERSTDARGFITQYVYDERGNILTKTEAFGTSDERTTSYTWHPDHNRITSDTRQSVSKPEASAEIFYQYDANGNLLTITKNGFAGDLPVTRTTTYTYNEYGQIKTADGPRTDVNDVTVFEYYPDDATYGLNRGRLEKMTDAMSRVTLYSNYDAFGHAREITDINGVTTESAYDAMGRLKSRTADGITVSYTYDGTGNLTTTQFSDGRTITNTYKDNGLLETVSDNAGNRVRYFYDDAGNRIGRKFVIRMMC